MLRKVLAAGMLVAALYAVVWGVVAESGSRDVREPIFEHWVILGAGLIVAAVLVLAAYLLWPKSK